MGRCLKRGIPGLEFSGRMPFHRGQAQGDLPRGERVTTKTPGQSTGKGRPLHRSRRRGPVPARARASAKGAWGGLPRAMCSSIASSRSSSSGPTSARRRTSARGCSIEARAANHVDHAHIIDIHDIGETDGRALPRDGVPGGRRSRRRSPRASSRWRARGRRARQMAAALGRAHDLGVVHRDLKSDNILLTNRGGRKGLRQDPRLRPRAPRPRPAARA